MSYKVLYRKYRPSDFDNVVGQDYSITMLKNAISSGKNSHAYIFTGPRGTGKTTCAKLFAKAINCENPVDGNPCGKCSSCEKFHYSPDIIEIDAASNNGVDEIRQLIDNVRLVPSELKYKVYIIDEVHMLSTSAFNALLLTLEEPPSHVIFILATTDIQNVPITILSRCQRIDFKPVNIDAMKERINYVCKAEKIKITDDAINEICMLSSGGMRDALGMLDQLSSNDENITLERVSDYFGSVSVKKVDELLDCLFNNDLDKFIEIYEVIKNSGTNYAVFIEKVLDELRKKAVLYKLGNNFGSFNFDDFYNLIFDLNDCFSKVNINVDPFFLIEMVLLKYFSSENNELLTENFFETNNKSSGNNIEQPKDEMTDLGNNVNLDENLGNKLVDKKETKRKTLENNLIDPMIRINNCFVECTKDKKKELISSWIDFMNYLMNEDRNLVSMLADTVVLAASDSYVLIQSSVDSTNELINNQIDLLESFYNSFSGNNYKFAAVNEKLWKEETEKYRENLKNKIEYSYIEETTTPVKKETKRKKKSDELEDIANDIFGSYDVI
jgi:DNA polymerase-3 subunit gamma/tau